ncbi:dihydrolipoamide acetyltransferase family protein [Flavobacterium sp.]|uniref:dihydrolipoamide acetyltransferase family protein n=1 Tax=Flavobacterium sp. TaxID=239 RepID=UPI00286EA25F|nr:dihydrolipoamide acetyltransferase family protein [Flavobacterium sp.]
MARFELKLPKMGESVAEATITNWLKQVGDKIEADEAVLEVATDKVDSELPSEVSGILVEQLFGKDDLVQVGQTIAIIETESPPAPEGGAQSEVNQDISESLKIIESSITNATDIVYALPSGAGGLSEKFFSPLVKNIAKEEGISVAELENITGSGKDGRVTKEDILNYIQTRLSVAPSEILEQKIIAQSQPITFNPQPIISSLNGGDEIIEMDRMRKLIAGYMMASVQTSAHVQSFIEVDVTNIVKWRDKVKTAFENREGEKLTYTPIFMEAVAKALKDFPMMNISVDGETIIKRKNINLGMAASLPNGNLIVPVIKNADQLNLVGMAKAVNDLGGRAKAGKLKPDDTQGGTYTVTNVGTFGSVFGTPIINQPQVGILALGAIRKVPAVIETPEGDFIGIRQKMFLSHSYDHRVVDGALGGSFVKRVAEYLEAFDVDRNF